MKATIRTIPLAALSVCLALCAPAARAAPQKTPAKAAPAKPAPAAAAPAPAPAVATPEPTEPVEEDYSIIGAETVHGRPVADVQAGWPGISFGYTFPIAPTSDLGLRFALLYSFEGTTTSQFGMAVYVPLRFELGRGDPIRSLLHVDPGGVLYTTQPAKWGFKFPVGIVFALPRRNGLEIGLGVDVNMTLLVTGDRAPMFIFGPAIGPYVEYHLNPRVTLGLNSRFGAAIDAYSSFPQARIPGGVDTNFAFLVQMMVGYRP
jgi:hypothetical protein